MLEVTFEIGGRKIRPSSIGNALERACVEEVKSEIERKLRGVRDPATGRSPKVKVTGRNLRNLSFEVEGSPELIELVKRRLG